MGRIKTQLIKASASKMVRKHLAKLTSNFEENKQILASDFRTPSRKLRNAIIGYVTRLVKNKRVE